MSHNDWIGVAPRTARIFPEPAKADFAERLAEAREPTRAGP